MTINDEFKSAVNKLYGETVTIWGPYKCADGRLRVDLKTTSTPRGHTVLLARLLLEIKLGRRLNENETVDHDDGDKTNDSPSNLKVMSLADNASESAFKLVDQWFLCPECKHSFKLGGSRLRDAVNGRKSGKAGPFCSRKCSGTYGAGIRNKTHARLKVEHISRTYTNGKGVTRTL